MKKKRDYLLWLKVEEKFPVMGIEEMKSLLSLHRLLKAIRREVE